MTTIRIQNRRGTSSQWELEDPTLNAGEIGVETDTGKFKIGDGTTAWTTLSYAATRPTDLTNTVGDYVQIADVGTAGNPPTLDVSKNLIVPGASIIVEGSTDNGYETTITVTDPTADRTITIPNNSGTVALTEDIPGIIESHVQAGNGILTLHNNSTGKYDIFNDGVISLAGTANQTAVSDDNAGGYTVALANDVTIPNNLTITGTTTLSGAPTQANHAATKAYVDNTAAGLNFHAPVAAATTANLTATYNNGTSGVGATLTNSGSNEALSIDGYSLSLNQRVLVKNQTTGSQNGLYYVSTVGDGSTPWVLTRATDADNSPAGEIAYGDFCFIQNGGQAGYGFIVNTTGTITIGTTAIAYVQFNAGQVVVAGNGLQEATPGTISIDTSVTADLSTSQTLTNKSINLANNTLSGTVAEFNSALSGADFATLLGVETLSGKTISGSNNTISDIGNGSLTNSSVTIGSTDVSLGGTAQTLAGLTSVTSTTFTGDLNGDVNGNASSATTLQTARNIAGQSFDGSASISIAPTDLTGVTASAAEINILDGATLTTLELNILNGVTATASEINTLDGITASVTELNILDGVTASASEINILDGATLSTTELNYVDGVTSAIQTQLDAKASLSGATFTGDVSIDTNLTVDGNLTVTGTTTTVSATDLVVTDPLIYIGEGNTGNLVDLGVVGSFNDGTYQHSGIVRDASAGTWKIFKGVIDEPTTTINFGQGSLDNLAIAGLTATSATIGDVSNTELQYLNGVTSAVQTQIDTKEPSQYSFVSVTGTSRTISSSTDKYKMLNFTNGSAITVTIPTDAADASWAIGDYVDISQLGGGQISFSFSGVSLRSAGNQYKTRVQYSSVTLVKIASNEWLLTGDSAA